MCGRLILHVNDEATTFELPPGTHCHSSGRARVVSAASEMSTLRRKVTCHCTVHSEAKADLQSKNKPRCTKQERRASRASPRLHAQLEAVAKRPVQRVVVLATGRSARSNLFGSHCDHHVDGRARRTRAISKKPSRAATSPLKPLARPSDISRGGRGPRAENLDFRYFRSVATPPGWLL